jgi:two-component system, OmpR family, response regulator VanR
VVGKIIIQERDKDVANILRILLSQAGYNVMVIGNPKSLKSLISIFKADAVILEYFQGEKEAVQLLRFLRRTYNLKVIATSCNASKDEIYKLGFDEFLEKPFDSAVVVALVKETLSKPALK